MNTDYLMPAQVNTLLEKQKKIYMITLDGTIRHQQKENKYPKKNLALWGIFRIFTINKGYEYG